MNNLKLISYRKLFNTSNKLFFFVNASERALFSLKVSAGYDDISFDFVRNFFGKVYDPLQHNFKISLQKGAIADNSKITEVISVFNAIKRDGFRNYRSKTVLPCFTKILEKIRYNFL